MGRCAREEWQALVRLRVPILNLSATEETRVIPPRERSSSRRCAVIMPPEHEGNFTPTVKIEEMSGVSIVFAVLATRRNTTETNACGQVDSTVVRAESPSNIIHPTTAAQPYHRRPEPGAFFFAFAVSWTIKYPTRRNQSDRWSFT